MISPTENRHVFIENLFLYLYNNSRVLNKTTEKEQADEYQNRYLRLW